MAQVDLASTERAAPPRLGEILVARGAVSRRRLKAALRRQRRVGAPLGEILCASGAVRRADVLAALAEQRARPFIDLEAQPPDPSLMDEGDLIHCLQRRALPWRREEGRLVFAAADPGALMGAELFLRRAFRVPRHLDVEVVACAPEAFEAVLSARFAPELARRAASRTPERLSARGLTRPGPRLALGAALAGAAALLALAPQLALPALFLAALALNAVNVGLRLAVMALPARRSVLPCPAPAEPEPGPPPRITLIIALYREPQVAAQLIEGLRALDYPPERLEAILALEEGDVATRAAIEAADPPRWARILVTPPGGPRTKPRALNHALDFASGDIIGVYDAEDRPEPRQLRKVAAAFAGSSAKLACVQARLAFRNEADGWIPRCFAVEYATWFHVMLPGMAQLGFPLPLGGTSLFFRRAALERLGAWDAHNVTEDADLGIRLARAGYVTGLIDSETDEEATRTPLAWIRQRSRWQKGYLMTWLTHMRAPRRLWRDLGPRGFLGFQALFLGAASAFLAQPLFWAVWVWPALAGPVFDPAAALGALGHALAGALLMGQAVMAGSSVLALRRAGRRNLIPTALSLPFYWPMGVASALKSLVEAAAAPLYWDKTEHGRPPRRGLWKFPRSR